jgi:ribonuclease BN (tRNA processing enzyme)
MLTERTVHLVWPPRYHRFVMALEVVALGVGDAFSAEHYSSCLAVGCDGAWLLIDCPHPIRKILRESGAGLDVGSFDACVVTHLHADHASGLEGYGYFSFFALRRPARLLMHPAVSARLWDGHLAAGMEDLMSAKTGELKRKRLDDYYALQALDEDLAVHIGPFSIECRRTIHHIPTTALRIRAGGRCFAYSADTAFDPALIEWLSAGDLIIHETNLGVHTPYEKLAALPAELRARMRLIHYPDEFPKEDRAIRLVRQGERLVV